MNTPTPEPSTGSPGERSTTSATEAPARKSDRLERAVLAAGVVTWLASSSPLIWAGLQSAATGWSERYWGWVACFLFFGSGFLFGRSPGGRRARHETVATVVQLVAAIGALALYPLSVPGFPANAIWMVIVAARLESLRWGLAGIAVMTAALGAIFYRTGFTPLALFGATGAYLGFQLFAWHSARLASRERRLREDLAHTLDELEATRELLSQSARIAERERISRDLHDGLGHHLAALALNLELARHKEGAEAAKSLETAHSLCKLMLAEVRDVVHDLRSAGALDIPVAVALLTRNVPVPRIHVSFAEGFQVEDPQVAEVLVRCTQEAITNTVRHADAENLWLDFTHDESGVRLIARDDGVGAKTSSEAGDREGARGGSGWKGMEHRLAAVAGRLRIDRGGDGTGGVTLAIEIPIGGTS